MKMNKIFFFHRYKTEFITTLVLFLFSKVKKIHIINLLPNYSINLEGVATTTVHVDCGHLHTVQWPEISNELISKIEKTLTLSNKIVYVTDALKNESKTLAPDKHNNNGITALMQFDMKEVGKLQQRCKKFDLITVSTSQKRKNWSEFFKIISQTKRSLDICLVIDSIFESKYGQELEKAKQQGHRINLYKSIEREELNKLYQASVYYLHCSTYEGFGIPIFEAIAHGATAVVRPTSILEEIYHEFAVFYRNTNQVCDILTENEMRMNKATEIRRKYCDVKGFLNRIEAFASE